jgi:hypothetical protein
VLKTGGSWAMNPSISGSDVALPKITANKVPTSKVVMNKTDGSDQGTSIANKVIAQD